MDKEVNDDSVTYCLASIPKDNLNLLARRWSCPTCCMTCKTPCENKKCPLTKVFCAWETSFQKMVLSELLGDSFRMSVYRDNVRRYWSEIKPEIRRIRKREGSTPL